MARILIFLNPVLAGSYYVASKAIIARYNPFLFTTIDSGIVAPVCLLILIMRARGIERQQLLKGICLGALLAINILSNIVAVFYTTATDAGFYPAMIGALAVVFSAIVLKERIPPGSYLAAALSIVGSCALIVSNLSDQSRFTGNIIAFLSNAEYVIYIFMMDRLSTDNKDTINLWAVQILTVAAISAVSYILFEAFAPSGVWPTHPNWRADVPVFLYVGVFTTLVPTLGATFAQKYVSALFTSFFYLLEPIWTIILAWVFLAEKASILTYVFGLLIVAGSATQYYVEVAHRKSHEETTA
ncbi:DMT family transporter [Acidiphilium sp. JA12-A1]|uniref:DMT family transporter n=1 Tax=Acidiphilium sp. JA12-A1 TaxID=1464546 RepID=UPI0019684433|nr:DMT family transporter [Acidiphilium sp. JA12-A1]